MQLLYLDVLLPIDLPVSRSGFVVSTIKAFTEGQRFDLARHGNSATVGIEIQHLNLRMSSRYQALVQCEAIRFS